jgi:hypothetical protein
MKLKPFLGNSLLQLDGYTNNKGNEGLLSSIFYISPK